MAATTQRERLGRCSGGALLVVVQFAIMLSSPSESVAEDLVRRPVPDLDGRRDPEPDATDALLWIPRIVFSPVYLTTEYLLRRPLGALFTLVEEAEVIEFLVDLFTFGEDDNILVLPTFLFEFGLSPSAGILVAWKDFVVDDNTLSFHGGFWGTEWLSFIAVDEVSWGDDTDLSVLFKSYRRPDLIYGGTGFDATGRTSDVGLDYGRYGETLVESRAHLALRPFRSSQLDYEVGFRHRDFADEGWRQSASAGDLAAQLGEERPVGLDTGFDDVFVGFTIVIDTRDPDEPPSSGVRARAFAEQHVVVGGLPDTRWIRWGADAALAYDLFGEHHVLGVSGGVALTTPSGGSGDIPFTELIDPGGNGPFRGFQEGVLRGMSGAVLVLDYTYAIWAFMSARLHVAVGNVFDENFSDFDIERTRMSFGLGLEPIFGGGGNPFEITLAAGTETFERGAVITNFRFVLGTRSDL